MRGSHGKCKEADQAQRCQIGFVLDERRELLQQQSRKCIISSMDSPRNVDDTDRNRNANCKLVKPQALQWQYVTAVLRVSGGRPKNEKELPGEGVEVPGLVVGIAMRLPTEVPRQKIDCPREDHWER